MVSISHESEVPQESYVPLSTSSLRKFRVIWDKGEFPRAANGCGGVPGCVAQGTDCVCNTTEVSKDPVFVDGVMPSKAEVVEKLSIGAFDPAMFDNNTYVKCVADACSSSNDDNEGVVAWLFRGLNPDPSLPIECKADLSLWLVSAGHADGNIASLAVAYDGVDSGYDDSWMGIGYNVVVFHPVTHEVVRSGGPWSIRDDHQVANNATLAFLEAVEDGHLVALTVKRFVDDNSKSYISSKLSYYLSTHFGAQHFGQFTNHRDSYGLIAFKKEVASVGAAATTTPLAEATTPTTTGAVHLNVTLGCDDVRTLPPSSSPTPAPTARPLFFNEHTVFEILPNNNNNNNNAQGRQTISKPSKFYLNMESTVSFGGGSDSSNSSGESDGDSGEGSSSSTSFSFRNPPRFLSRAEPTVRDAEYETEAVLDMYFHHPNLPPFVATRLIQRFVSSNPSRRYVEVVATAFMQGVYTYNHTHSSGSQSGSGGGSGSGGDVRLFGNGERGNLEATVAAVLLDREARSPILDNDLSHGSLREPLNKFLHLLRVR
jgi:hypothetical protein